MHNKNRYDRAHAQEMDDATVWKPPSSAVSSENWIGFPQHQAGGHDQHADQQNADIEQALDRVVVRGIIMREPEMQRVGSCP